MPIVALDPDTNVLGALDQLHCVLYSDGADTCVVNEPLEVFDQQSTAVSEIDTSGTEPAPAVRFVDAIPAVVVQTVTVAALGFDARENEQTEFTRPQPPAEPASNVDAKTTTGELAPRAGQPANAVVVAIIQSATIAVPGQSARGSGEVPQGEAMPASTTPASIGRAIATALDEEE